MQEKCKFFFEKAEVGCSFFSQLLIGVYLFLCTCISGLGFEGFGKGGRVVFLVAFCSGGGFRETANKSWTSWWTEIVFCQLEFTVCFPSLVHSLFITLSSVSLGLCSLQQLDGFRNCYTVFPCGTQGFMEATI